MLVTTIQKRIRGNKNVAGAINTNANKSVSKHNATTADFFAKNAFLKSWEGVCVENSSVLSFKNAFFIHEKTRFNAYLPLSYSFLSLFFSFIYFSFNRARESLGQSTRIRYRLANFQKALIKYKTFALPRQSRYRLPSTRQNTLYRCH